MKQAHKLMFAITTALPNSLSIADQRHRVAQLIDHAAEDKHRPVRVLAAASGHLREAELSTALCRGKVHEIVALDQDLRSLEGVQRDYARVHNRPVVSATRLNTPPRRHPCDDRSRPGSRHYPTARSVARHRKQN